jgi:hypothetical protein
MLKKMKIKKILTFIYIAFLLVSVNNIEAQELNCNVNVLTPNLDATQKRLVGNIKNSLKEFMNNTRFTQEGLAFTERIECNLLLTITEVSGNEYGGTLQIQASRPVYGTSYNSTIFNVLDRSIKFQYQEFQQFEYQKGTYVQDLTSILAFYAYIILGYDADTYSPLGGNPYFAEANAVVQSAQTASIQGWKPNEKNERNRYQLIFELTDQRMVDVRKTMYAYHRQGFDIMSEDLEKGRENILKSVEALRTPYKFNPFSYLVSCFFLAKKDELINLFKQAPSSEKTTASNLFQELDIPNANKYSNELK